MTSSDFIETENTNISCILFERDKYWNLIKNEKSEPNKVLFLTRVILYQYSIMCRSTTYCYNFFRGKKVSENGETYCLHCILILMSLHSV